MAEIEIPFPLKDVPIKPELTGRAKIDETIIQTLAAMLGWDGEARRLLTCALSGALHTTTPAAAGSINGVSSGANEDVTFPDHPTTEVMVQAGPSNSGDLWVDVHAAASENDGWRLDAGDYVKLSINNLSHLHIHVMTSGDRYCVLRTV